MIDRIAKIPSLHPDEVYTLDPREGRVCGGRGFPKRLIYSA